MARAQYLKRRAKSGIYFVRLCVPERLKAVVSKGEVHRTTGCRDLRLAKIVAAEQAAHWHSAMEKLARMDPTKVKAGSLDLLGEGLISLDHAATLLGADRGRLAEQLLARQAKFFVAATDWSGWLAD